MKASQPFHQGQLDFFCAIYAVINALKLTGELGLAEGREILADSLREVSARPLLWDALLTNQTDYYWLLRWLFGHFGRRYGSEFMVGRLPVAPLSKKQRKVLTGAGKACGQIAGEFFSTPSVACAATPEVEGESDRTRDAGRSDDSRPWPREADAGSAFRLEGQLEGRTVGDVLQDMELPAVEAVGPDLDGLSEYPDAEPARRAFDGARSGARPGGRGLYGLTDEELRAWVGLAAPARYGLDSVTRDELYERREPGAFGRELKWNMEELWPLLQSWLPVKSLFGSLNADNKAKRCLILRFHRHLYASHPPLISHWSVGREFQRDTLQLFDCTADKNAIHSLPFRETVLSELQLGPDRLLRLEPDSVFFIEKL